MSTYMYSNLRARGNTKTLEEFVNFFEGEYDDQEVHGWIKQNYFHHSLKGNSYTFAGEENYLWIDTQKLSKMFPALKFEYIQECSDGTNGSDYTIYINGKVVDSKDGNSLAFGDHEDHVERCVTCNCVMEYETDGCAECGYLFRAIYFNETSDENI